MPATLYNSALTSSHAPAGLAPASMPGRLGEHDLQGFVKAVLWRKWLILGSILAGILLGAAVFFLTPTTYKSEALLDAGTARMADGIGLAALANPANLQTQVQVLSSPALLEKLAGKLNLYADPEFAGVFEQNSETGRYDRILRTLSKGLNVELVPGSSVVAVRYSSPSPEKAAMIANTLVDLYLERQITSKFDDASRNAKWMSQRLETLKQDLGQAQHRLDVFAAENDLGAVGDIDLTQRGALGLDDQKSKARAELTALQSTLDRIDEIADKNPEGLEGIEEIATSPTVAALRQNEVAAQTRIAELGMRYGDRHPALLAANRELAQTRASLRAEVQNTVARLQNQKNLLEKQITSVDSQFDAAQGDYRSQSQARVQLSALMADVDSGRRVYEDFLNKYREVLSRADMQSPDGVVISRAPIPTMPDRIGFTLMLALGGVMGLFAGLFAALAAAGMQNVFLNAGELEQACGGYPVYGVVPAAENNAGGVRAVIENPAGPLAEAMRSLRMNLRLRAKPLAEDAEKTAQVLSFTSTKPDEGKTTLSVWLAAVAAKAGERVVIVDCDLRRPSLHKSFGIGNAKGLADYLADRLALNDVIHRKDPSGIHLITAKAVPGYALTLLTSGHVERLIRALKEDYDLIILDAPSSLSFADARILSRVADTTLYAVEWNRTRRDLTVASLKQYADMGCTDLALVLNRVDPRHYPYAGYDEPGQPSRHQPE